MLEVKNLTKCYSTKGGVTVKALDDVSLKFPETGMVFLLGRSGSGKSTLLNVSGGLDRPDSGEVIVKGKSSTEFSGSDFDSYRNTFVGFIFQEYNILNEFTVEQNIALALQLQNKKNDKKAVNELLEQVDLQGFGKRKPNTLSGGQKQRVAIARALIKEPEIIMADEPTGALDSNTGKQVFDTLKKLSKTKLVVVVSHDRDFAEQYGDRIIELKDGKILSDVSKAYSQPQQLSGNVQLVSDDTISIKDTESITEADVKTIVNMLKKNKGEAIISSGQRDLPDVKRACKINDDGSKEYFSDTKDVKTEEYDGKQTKFIKSRLPASHAFKMGASGLKTKPIRLVFTILLSIIAFAMFGIVSTFMLYDPDYSVSEALKEADYPSITISKYYSVIDKSIKVDNSTGEESVEYENERLYLTRIGVKELDDKNAQGLKFAGIFNFTNNRYGDSYSTDKGSIVLQNGSASIPFNVKAQLKEYYANTDVYGFTDCGAEYMNQNGFTLVAGNYPTTDSEIAIPEYLAELYVNTEDSGITEVSQMVNKKVTITGFNAVDSNHEFTVTGVYNVGKLPQKFDALKNNDSSSMSKQEKEALTKSLVDHIAYSFNSIIYVTEDFYEKYKGNISQDMYSYVESTYVNGIEASTSSFSSDYVIDENWGKSFYTDRTIKDYPASFEFYSLDGAKKNVTEIGENEVYVSFNEYKNIYANVIRHYAQRLTNELYYYDVASESAIGPSSDFCDVYMNAWDFEAVAPLLPNINTWYKVLAEKEYIYNAASNMINYPESSNSGYESSSEFGQAFSRVQAAKESRQIIDDADWTILKNGVYTAYATVCEKAYYGDYFKEAYKFAEASYRSNIVYSYFSGEDVYNIINLMYTNSVSSEIVEKVKAFVNGDPYVSVMGYAKKTDHTRFNANLEFSIDKVYYKNYLGQTGYLTVAGYFNSIGYEGVSYVVNRDFLESYGKFQDNGQDFTWKNREETTYKEPEDAKYNYAITLTDNSQEQISSALSSADGITYKINNSVCNELDMFLSMITEMKQIFLIIGLVLGVFSALMLLNFISVSISAKKKDIGILRAVGARGTDVFKIFFAEAFIIAIICFVISTIGAYVVCGILNSSLVSIVNMKLLNFQLINVLMILGVSFGISLIATFFPVFFAARKSPVESIRAL